MWNILFYERSFLMTDNKIKMPVWGPYSKKYMGISKIVNELADINAKINAQASIDLKSCASFPNSTVQHLYLMSRYHQIIIYGAVKTITLSIHTDMNLCGKTRFMPIFRFQKLMKMHTL